MLSRLVANPAVRFFAILILIVEMVLFTSVIGELMRGGGSFSWPGSVERGQANGARDLTTDWIMGVGAFNGDWQSGPMQAVVGALMLGAAAIAGYQAIRTRGRESQAMRR